MQTHDHAADIRHVHVPRRRTTRRPASHAYSLCGLPLAEIALAPSPAGSTLKLRITMREIHAKVHRDMPATRMWSYGAHALAPLIDVRSHQPLHRMGQSLPTQHFLPIDHSLHGCGRDVPDVRTSSICTADGFHPKTTASPKTGLSPANSRPAPTRWNRTPPPSGTTTTPWGSTASTCTPASSAWCFYATTPKTHSASPRAIRGPTHIYDRQFTTDGQLLLPRLRRPRHPWVPEFGGSSSSSTARFDPTSTSNHASTASASLTSPTAASSPCPSPNGHPSTRSAPIRVCSPRRPKSPIFDSRLRNAPTCSSTSLKPLARRVQLINGAVGVHRIPCRPATSKPVSTRPCDRNEPTAESIPSTLRAIDRIPESAAITTRTITLNEYDDKIGNSMLMLLNRKHWHEPVTETPRLNTTEIWELRQSHRRHPSHALAPGALPGPRPPRSSTSSLIATTRASLPRRPPSHPNPTNKAGRTPCSASQA